MNKILLSTFILLAGAFPAKALSVLDSKHNLASDSATSGPKAVNELLTCLFCHTMHKPAQMTALWNRVGAPVDFTFYSSNYLNNYLGQATPTMTDLKASKTKLCLSCHDGVTALGALYNIAPNTLEMTGTLGASSVIGTDLSNDHPVLYDVKPGAGPPTPAPLGAWVVASPQKVLPLHLALQALLLSWLIGVLSLSVPLLSKAQKDDGGFPVAPGSNSNTESTAWVLSALYALGDSLSIWSPKGVSPEAYLLAQVQSSGHAGFDASSKNITGRTPTTTAYAAIALSGKYFPIKIIDISTSFRVIYYTYTYLF